MSVVFCKGVPIFQPNTTYNIDDKCYISYNTNSSWYGCETTAIVRADGVHNTKFLILNGNHIQELIKCNCYQECVEYFKQHLKNKNKKSENWDEELDMDNEGKILGYKKMTII